MAYGLTEELKNILWACNEYYSNITSDEKQICHNWINKTYKKRFGIEFHQSKLIILSKLGYLKSVDASRGGKRVYYKIVSPRKPNDIN